MDDENFDWLLPIPCPECGATRALAGMLWGLPSGLPEGNVVLGGCVDPNFDFLHVCVECGWGGEVDRSGRARTPTRAERVLGCLLGGAIGDALGAPVEFWSSSRIHAEFPEGVRDYIPTGYGDDLGLITDDTQMTLFTLEALLRVWQDDRIPRLIELHRSYLDWWQTQSIPEPPPDAPASSLASQTWLYSRRAPGNTCASALISALASGRLGQPATNDSKGCGGVMRSAPFGLLPMFDGPDLACAAAALTHGHPSGQVSSGALAELISQLMSGRSLKDALLQAIGWSQGRPGGEETTHALTAALDAALTQVPPTFDVVERLGGGWVGEEALAIGAYCALAHPGRDQVLDALSLAVSHGGDSDSTGEICGQILGTLHGVDALPAELVARVEGRTVIEAMAAQTTEAILARSRVLG